MGTQPPPKKEVEPGDGAPQFSANVYCGQMAGWIKMALGIEVELGPGHIVLDGDPPPPLQKWGRGPQFSVHFYCGQTAGCMKMPLRMEVGLGAGHIVLDVDPAPPKRGEGTAPPAIFGPCILCPNGWMDQASHYYGGRRQPRRH